MYGVLTLTAAAAAAASPAYGVFVEGDRVGPGLLPLVSATIIALLSAISLAGSWRAFAPAGSHMASGGADALGRTTEQRARMVWMVLGLLLISALAVNVIGFLASLGTFTIVVAAAVEGRPVARAILLGGTATAVAYLIFVRLLSVPLPTGIFLP